MKKLFSIIAVAAIALCNTFTSSAQETSEDMVTYLVVNLKDGSMEKYMLKDSPVVKMEDSKIMISSESAEAAFDFDQVGNFTFEEGLPSGVESVVAGEAAFEFSYIGNTVTVAAPALEWAAVYTIGGVQGAKVPDDADHTAVIDLSTLAPGIYVVAPSCHSAIKIVKR